VAQTELWMSANFWQPPYRSWPHPPTELEVLATRMGIGDEELRELLRDEIQRRLRERGEAWEKLDRTLEKRANSRDSAVAQSGNGSETTPRPHQHRI
jgi:hypothetical protein